MQRERKLRRMRQKEAALKAQQPKSSSPPGSEEARGPKRRGRKPKNPLAPTSPRLHHEIPESDRTWVDIPTWVGENRGDAAFKVCD